MTGLDPKRTLTAGVVNATFTVAGGTNRCSERALRLGLAPFGILVIAGASLDAGTAEGRPGAWQNPVGEMVFICIKDSVATAPLAAPTQQIADACQRNWAKWPTGRPHSSNVYCSFLLGNPIRADVTPERFAEVLMLYRQRHPASDPGSYSEWALEARQLLVRPATAWLAAARRAAEANATAVQPGQVRQ